MRIKEILRHFHIEDPDLKLMAEAIAEHAYEAGRRDASRAMLTLALEMDDRVSKLVDRPHGFNNGGSASFDRPH